MFTANDAVPEVFGGTIDWGDGTEPTAFAGNPAAPSGYKRAGVRPHLRRSGTYTVTVNLADGDGGTATRTASVHIGDLLVRAFNDANGDGVRGTADTARVGATVFLDLDRDGAPDPGEPTGTTDGQGDVLFSGEPDTGYAARVVAPGGWHVSTPGGASVEMTPGSPSAAAGFGFSQAATAGGTVFNDANFNGVRDPGETTPILTVRARRTDTGAAITTTSDSAGGYRFTGLMPGPYVIELTSTSHVVTAPFGRRGYAFTLSGEDAGFQGLDIGSFAGTGTTVSGSVFTDSNENDTHDPGESGLAGQTVYVDANDNGVADPDEWTALTTSSGGWSIRDCPRAPTASGS